MQQSICIIKNGYYSNPRVFRDANTLYQDGFNVDVICLRDKDEKLYEKIDGIKVFRIPIFHRRGGVLSYILEYGGFFVFSFFLLNFLFIKRKYIVVQVINVPDFLVFLAIIPKILGSKIILAMPEPFPELLMTINKNAHFLKKFLNILQFKSCEYADLILPVTNAMKEYLVKKGVSETKVDVILNVPDERLFGKNTVCKNNDDRIFKLVYAGAIIERFGIETMINAIHKLEKEIPLVILDIYGSGEFSCEAQRKIKILNLEKKITLHGFIKPEKVPEVLKAADVCLVTILKNSYSELVQTHKMFEAVASKKPVIASRISSFFECFDESCICYFESGSADELAKKIISLYNHPNKRLEFVNNAYSRYNVIRWEEGKKIYLELVKNLVQ
jgi:glycosyltransferase involved in cell wall biosynthesis